MYQVRSGDTLSAIALRNRTSLASLLRENPAIRNADRIRTGLALRLPGARDTFERGAAARPATNTRPSATTAADQFTGSGVTRGKAFETAKQYLGQNARDLKVSGSPVGRFMDNWVPNNVNCANFVSGVLQASGQIKYHDNSVRGLMGKLDRDPNFKRVGLKDAKPGDVVSMRVGSGQHVVMFAGWKNGRPQFIGSNNVNADGSQKVSFSSSNYPIMAIHQHR